MARASEIQSHLTARGGVLTGNKIKLKCPWHKGGTERTASLFVSLHDPGYPPGNFVCWGCSPPRRGPWKDLAIKLGIITGSIEEDEAPYLLSFSKEQLDQMLNESGSADHSLLTREPIFPKNLKWRGINGWLLNALSARITEVNYFESRVYLPIMQNDEWKSGIYCTWNDTAKVKYLNEAGTQTSELWFPYDYVRQKLSKIPKKKRVVMLVEGPRDALNPLQNDILTLANLGGDSIWSNTKVELIADLEVNHIITAFDPDKVGRALTKLAKRDLQSFVQSIRRFKMQYKVLPNGKKFKEDPGSLTYDRMQYLKRQYEKLMES